MPEIQQNRRMKLLHPYDSESRNVRLANLFKIGAVLAIAAFVAYGCSTKSTCTEDPVPPVPALTQLPPPLPAPASHDEKMAWFREAKFGLFIHWGLYCIPAGDWNGKRVPGIGEWIMHNAPIPVTQY